MPDGEFIMLCVASAIVVGGCAWLLNAINRWE